jgi:hypothetical protein
MSFDLPLDNFFAPLGSSIAPDDLEPLDDEFLEILADFDVSDEVWASLMETDFTEHQDPLQFTTSDILNVLGDGIRREDKPDYVNKDFPPHIAPRAFRHLSPKPSPILGTKLVGRGGSVIIEDAMGVGTVVGRSTVDFVIDMPHEDLFSKAMIMNEEVSGKGMCLGFSSLVHLVACLVFCQDDHVLEPIEGHDVIWSGITVEVTGMSWDARKTSAAVCINKYPLAMSYATNDMYTQFVHWSHCEDTNDATMLIGSGYDQGHSPYSKFVRKMSELTTTMAESTYEDLYKQLRSYYSRKPRYVEELKSEPFDQDGAVSHVIDVCKNRLSGTMAPAPFRALPSHIKVPKDQAPHVQTWYATNGGESTYRTFPAMYDPQPYLHEKMQTPIELPYQPSDSLTDYVLKQLCYFATFQACYLESELFGKIRGKVGDFYSEYLGVGITWKLVRSRSLVYYANFFCYGKQPPQCGSWELLDPDNELYRSPSFKVSIQDISFAKVLPWRMVTMVVSVLAHSYGNTRRYVVSRLIMLMGLMRGSSWETSHIFKDCRYITLCAIAGSGDVAGLIEKCFNRLDRPASFPNYYMLWLLLDLASRLGRYDGKTTPILSLPLKFMAIEKDMTQSFMWHIRGDHHAEDCFTKLMDRIVSENMERPRMLAYYDMQLQYLEELQAKGATQEQFDVLMDCAPKEPHYNHIMFLALSWRSASDLRAGRSQAPVGINLCGVMTDHHAVEPSHLSMSPDMVLKPVRVADGMMSLLSKFPGTKSIYELFYHLCMEDRLANIYMIHEKDAKHSNREIAQMLPHMRIAQYISESLITQYTEAEGTDMMQDSAKYSKFAESFKEVIGKRGGIRSEDKSFFAGYLQPEMMGLATQAVARMTGTASLTLAAAIQICDSSRYAVVPAKADNKIASGAQTTTHVYLRHQNAIVKKTAVLNYTHMMQGIRALGGALVNTIFCTGMAGLCMDLSADKLVIYTMQTSDDSTRGCYVSGKATYDPQTTCENALAIVPSECHRIMMKDSADKAIRADKLAEFNNVVAMKNGLLPQQFMHAHLVTQPLTGASLLDDILAVRSTARSSLTWGDSPDVMRTAYYGAVILLQQKWLLTPEELDLLHDTGFLVQSDEDIMTGRMDVKPEVLASLYDTLDDTSKEEVKSGITTPIAALRKHAIRDKTNPSKARKAPLPERPKMLRMSVKQINAARRRRGRMAAAHIRPLGVYAVLAAKSGFIEQIAKTSTITEEHNAVILGMPRTPNVTVVLSRPTLGDFAPQTIGGRVRTEPEKNVKAIVSMRETGVVYRSILTEEEKAISEMPEEEFEAWLNRYRQQEVMSGLAYKSPMGRPLVISHNSKLFYHPMSFNFVMDLPEPCAPPAGPTIDGKIWRNFELCRWGGGSLGYARTNGHKIAFGYQIDGEAIHVFSQQVGRALRHDTVEYNGENHVVVKRDGVSVRCQITPDYAPIPSGAYGMVPIRPYSTSLTGDQSAILNYGSWPHCNTPSGNKFATKLYRAFDSVLPRMILRYRPNFPQFHKQAVEIVAGSVTDLQGSSYISLLKLVYIASSPTYRQITCDTRPPRIRGDEFETVEPLYI